MRNANYSLKQYFQNKLSLNDVIQVGPLIEHKTEKKYFLPVFAKVYNEWPFAFQLVMVIVMTKKRAVFTSGQSYKGSTIVNYDSIVINICNLRA